MQSRRGGITSVVNTPLSFRICYPAPLHSEHRGEAHCPHLKLGMALKDEQR